MTKSTRRTNRPNAQERYAADRRRGIQRAVVVLVVLAALVLVRVFAPVCNRPYVGETPQLPAGERVEVERARIEVLDGDTVRLDGRLIRFLGCDAPESDSPHFRGNQDPWARRATAFVERQLREADRIEVETLPERDRYGRLLGHLFVDGEPLSLLLVEEGLAAETVSQYGDNGFPRVAERIREAAAGAEPLPFQTPRDWRRENRAN